MHEVSKTGSDSPIRVEFAIPEKVPPVRSDTLSMRTEIAWDNEGPFARRGSHSVTSPMAETTPTFPRISPVLQVPRRLTSKRRH